MQEHTHAGGRSAAALDPSGLVELVTRVREIGDLQPADIEGLDALLGRPAQPIRTSYVREGDAIALYARRALPAQPDEATVRCATLTAPEWLLDPAVAGPEELGAEVRGDLAGLVCASFELLEARLAQFAPTGRDTELHASSGAAPTLRIVPATTPSPRLEAALPSHAPGYAHDGDPHAPGGARSNRGTGGTGVDGTRAPEADAVPRNPEPADTLAGVPLAIEGTVGQALVEGSPTDEDPPAASPGRLGH